MSLNTHCETCRKRRVKVCAHQRHMNSISNGCTSQCDGARPNCTQCRQANRICFGFSQKETKFAFVLEKGTHPKKNPHKKMIKGQKDSATGKQPPRAQQLSLPSNSTESIPLSLTISLEDQAIAYYFQQHVIPPSEMMKDIEAYADYLPLMWMQSARNSVFCLAMQKILESMLPYPSDSTISLFLMKVLINICQVFNSVPYSNFDMRFLWKFLIMLKHFISARANGILRRDEEIIDLLKCLVTCFWAKEIATMLVS